MEVARRLGRREGGSLTPLSPALSSLRGTKYSQRHVIVIIIYQVYTYDVYILFVYKCFLMTTVYICINNVNFLTYNVFYKIRRIDHRIYKSKLPVSKSSLRVNYLYFSYDVQILVKRQPCQALRTVPCCIRINSRKVFKFSQRVIPV